MKQTSGGRKPCNLMQQYRISDNVGDRQDARNKSKYNCLTAREREIFDMTVRGLSSRMIASHLIISPRTVETHRENLMKKLGLHSKTELILYAFYSGPQISDNSVRW